jgi:predicted nucleic acid-binding protein
MDRVFLDANILFSAAYSLDNALLRLWKLPRVVLCTSHYAVEEAKVNLARPDQQERLAELTKSLSFFDVLQGKLPREISLPEKDVPIMLSAMGARASHLLTGDLRHFGRYFGKRFAGVLILPPAAYLQSRRVP